jgi:four helix bundle protein
MSYKNLEIWKLARELSIEVHKLTLNELPKFEMYEEGSQIRRSCKSVRSNIVEGYGRKKYQAEYYRFLTFALASNNETTDHLEILFETGSFKNKELFKVLYEKLDTLGRKINTFMQVFDVKQNAIED